MTFHEHTQGGIKLEFMRSLTTTYKNISEGFTTGGGGDQGCVKTMRETQLIRATKSWGGESVWCVHFFSFNKNWHTCGRRALPHRIELYGVTPAVTHRRALSSPDAPRSSHCLKHLSEHQDGPVIEHSLMEGNKNWRTGRSAVGRRR